MESAEGRGLARYFRRYAVVMKPESKKEKADKTMCISCGICRVSGLCLVWKPESEKTDRTMGEIVENQADEP